MANDGARLGGATPILRVFDLPQALDWYQRVLGFQVAWTWGEPADHASVCRDSVAINLVAEPRDKFTASHVYFETKGVDTFHERVVRAGGDIAVPIGNRPYGMRDFRVVDPAGNELSLGEPIPDVQDAAQLAAADIRDVQFFEGGCLCGAVRYRITGSPRSSSVCFCRSCRLASGAPSVAWFVVDKSQFKLLSGQLAAFQSSPPVTRSFCAKCGSPLAYQHADDLNAIELTTATLDDPNRLPPTREIWHSNRLSWAASDPAVPHFSEERNNGGA